MAASPPSFDFPDAEGFYSDRMHVPRTITIPDVGDEHGFSPADANRDPQGPQQFNMTSSMSIPERIIVNQTFESSAPSSVRLTDDAAPMPIGGMGGMITPPRTLTVDDTSSAYYPRGRPTGNARATNESRTNRDSAAARVDADVERLAQCIHFFSRFCWISSLGFPKTWQQQIIWNGLTTFIMIMKEYINSFNLFKKSLSYMPKINPYTRK